MHAGLLSLSYQARIGQCRGATRARLATLYARDGGGDPGSYPLAFERRVAVLCRSGKPEYACVLVYSHSLTLSMQITSSGYAVRLLIQSVLTMRDAQKNFFKTKSLTWLTLAKKYEAKVDRLVAVMISSEDDSSEAVSLDIPTVADFVAEFDERSRAYHEDLAWVSKSAVDARCDAEAPKATPPEMA